MALITDKKQVAQKAEATSGTAESLTATEATINWYDPQLVHDVPFVDTPSQGTSDADKGVIAGASGKMTGYTYICGKGSAADPTWMSVLLNACGTSGTGGVYTPLTGDVSTISIQVNHDSDLRKIAGAAGNFKITGKFGERWRCDWEFLGKYVAPTNTGLLSPTYDTVIAPRWAGTTNTIGGSAYKFSGFEFDAGNTLKLIEDAADTQGTPKTGYYACNVTHRKPVLTLRVMAPGIGTHDFFADYVASTTLAVSLVVGATANNITTLAVPKFQLIEPPTYEDNDGYLVQVLKGQCVKNSDAGEDSWSLTRS